MEQPMTATEVLRRLDEADGPTPEFGALVDNIVRVLKRHGLIDDEHNRSRMDREIQSGETYSVTSWGIGNLAPFREQLWDAKGGLVFDRMSYPASCELAEKP